MFKKKDKDKDTDNKPKIEEVSRIKTIPTTEWINDEYQFSGFIDSQRIVVLSFYYGGAVLPHYFNIKIGTVLNLRMESGSYQYFKVLDFSPEENKIQLEKVEGNTI